MGVARGEFVKKAVYVTGVAYLLFIIFAIIFSGSWHALLPREETRLFLEYVALAGVVVFCAGLGWFFIGGLRKKYPIIVMAVGSVISLAGFYVYWRNVEGVVAMSIILAVLVVQFFVTRGSRLEACHPERSEGSPV